MTGCDGEIQIEGKAFEWVDPPDGANSIIYISNASRLINASPESKPEATLQRLIDSIPSNITRIPLEGVALAWKPHLSKELVTITTSNANGDFNYWSLTDAGKYATTISASKDDYISASGCTNHQISYAHIMVIILVRDKNNE
jgi:hypothetical protein